MVQPEPDIVYAYRSWDCPEHGDNVTARRPRKEQTPSEWKCVQCDQPQPGSASDEPDQPMIEEDVGGLLDVICDLMLAVELAAHGQVTKPKAPSGKAEFDDVSNRTMVALRAYVECFSRVHPAVATAMTEARRKYYDATAAQTPKKDR